MNLLKNKQQSLIVGILVVATTVLLAISIQHVMAADRAIVVDETSDNLAVTIDASVLSQSGELLKNDDDKYVLSVVGPTNSEDIINLCHQNGWNEIKDQATEYEFEPINSARAEITIPLRQNLTTDYVFCFKTDAIFNSQQELFLMRGYRLENVLPPSSQPTSFTVEQNPPLEGTDIPSIVTITVANNQIVDSSSWQYAKLDSTGSCSAQAADESQFEALPKAEDATQTQASINLDRTFANSVLCFRAKTIDSDEYIYQHVEIYGIHEVVEEEDSINWIFVAITVGLIPVIIYFVVQSNKDMSNKVSSPKSSDKPASKNSQAKKNTSAPAKSKKPKK